MTPLRSITPAFLYCAFTLLQGATPSPVADAAMRGDQAAIRSLLDRKTDVTAAQPDGATALHWAAYRSDKDLAAVLIAAGANVKAANREGVTALQLAAMNGDAAIIEQLLAAGADA